MRFVSKPSTVEAVQWTGDNGPELLAVFGGKVTIEQHRTDEEFHCALLAGKDGSQEWVPVPSGHWLVHPPDDLSDIWPVADSYFQEKYEVDEDYLASGGVVEGPSSLMLRDGDCGFTVYLETS